MRAETGIGSLSGAIAALNLPDAHALARGPDAVLSCAHLPTLAKKGAALAGRRVAVLFRDRMRYVEAILALDGQADAMLLLAPDLPRETVAMLMAQAGVDALVSDRADLSDALPWAEGAETCAADPRETEWLLTTSGTTGVPKLVHHRRASIIRAVKLRDSGGARWAMTYDPGRFAGTQVLVQALTTGSTLLVPSDESGIVETIHWLAEQGCSHISATPSWWRRLLMAPDATRLPLSQITLGGEIADAAILSALAARFPQARISHVYASTEAGAAFSVRDGRPGFPARWLDEGASGVDLAVRDGILWLRPADAVLTDAAHIERDGDGFIRTGDRVAIEGDRVLFLGREDATLNVGGIKVQAETVEAVVHAHPAVAQCHVSGRPSALMGTLLDLSVVARDPAADAAALKREIAAWCRERLPPAARPATVRIVPEIATTGAGKLQRRGAA